jgi:hypothetical protein
MSLGGFAIDSRIAKVILPWNLQDVDLASARIGVPRTLVHARLQDNFSSRNALAAHPEGELATLAEPAEGCVHGQRCPPDLESGAFTNRSLKAQEDISGWFSRVVTGSGLGPDVESF